MLHFRALQTGSRPAVAAAWLASRPMLRIEGIENSTEGDREIIEAVIVQPVAEAVQDGPHTHCPGSPAPLNFLSLVASALVGKSFGFIRPSALQKSLCFCIESI